MNAVARDIHAGPAVKPRVLHVGCGSSPLPEWLGEFQETRLDADERVKPDIVASMTNLGDIADFDLIYCSHALEHLCCADVMKALDEFKRVLRPGGSVLVFVPDLTDVKPTFDVVYESPSGPVTGHDMYYGHILAADNPFMRHLTGFVQSTLAGALTQAGFQRVRVDRIEGYHLMGLGFK